MHAYIKTRILTAKRRSSLDTFKSTNLIFTPAEENYGILSLPLSLRYIPLNRVSMIRIPKNSPSKQFTRSCIGNLYTLSKIHKHFKRNWRCRWYEILLNIFRSHFTEENLLRRMRFISKMQADYFTPCGGCCSKEYHEKILH